MGIFDHILSSSEYMSYNIDKGQVYREDDGEVVGDIREITAAEALKILMG